MTKDIKNIRIRTFSELKEKNLLPIREVTYNPKTKEIKVIEYKNDTKK